MNFKPFDYEVVTVISVTPSVALKGESITFDGSSSYLIGDGADSSNLMYQWSCEAPFDAFCEVSSLSQDMDKMVISSAVFESVSAEYNKSYNVELVVLWVNPLGLEI